MGQEENESSNGESPPENGKGTNQVRLIRLFVEYVFYRIDRYIERHGLEPIVTRVKEGRWVLRVVLQLLMILYYLWRLTSGH